MVTDLGIGFLLGLKAKEDLSNFLDCEPGCESSNLCRHSLKFVKMRSTRVRVLGVRILLKHAINIQV